MPLADIQQHQAVHSAPDQDQKQPSRNSAFMDDIPAHPVRSLQAAFEESIIESLEEQEAQGSPVEASAERRRQKLLDSNQYNDSWQNRWRQRASAKYHPLLKLAAQITFGLHLLQVQQARSDDEVIRILKSHVSEVDNFLQRTTDDFELAIKDIEERIRFLKLPMEHIQVFEGMLEDKKFRTQLLEGNEKIQKVVDRTTRAMEGAMYDIHKALEAAKELGRYLDSVEGQWPADKPDLDEVVEVMRGNEQGWKRCMKNLQSNGNTLGGKMVQLATQMRDMSRLATLAAKRSRKRSKSGSEGSRSAPSSPGLRSKFCDDNVPPMPADSVISSPALSQAQSYEPEPGKFLDEPRAMQRLHSSPLPIPSDQFRQHTQPSGSSSPLSTKSASLPLRPKTSDSKTYSPRDARGANTRSDTKDLVDFFKQSSTIHVNPLRSNPPDARSLKSNASSVNDKFRSSLIRSSSHNVIDSEQSARHAHPPSSMPRSVSHNAMDTASIHTASSSISNPSNLKPAGAPALTAVPERNDQFNTLPANGFTRRISKRMLHITPNPAEPPTKPFAHQRESSNSSSPKLRPSRSSSTLNTNFTKLAPPSESEEDAYEETASTLASGPMPTDGMRTPQPATVQSPAPPPINSNGPSFRQQSNMTSTTYSDLGSGRATLRAFPTTGGASIAETSASRRYRSLKRIFGKRDEMGRIGA